MGSPRKSALKVGGDPRLSGSPRLSVKFDKIASIAHHEGFGSIDPQQFHTGGRKSIPGQGAPKDEKSIRYKHRRTAMQANIDGLGEQIDLKDWEHSKGFRKRVGELMYSQNFEMVIGTIVLLNFATIAYEADGRCTMLSTAEDSDLHISTKEMMKNVGYLNLAFLFCYVSESSLRFFVERWKFHKSGWNLFDLFIVLCGIIGEIMERFLQDTDADTESMGVLRTMRMVRLLRVSRILISFQELYALISGLVNCMKTLTWAAGLVFISLTIWSIIAVEYIQPLMADLERAGHYTYCSWCPYAFQGIMKANLTFFQIISGDGWSSLARALIEEHPWTAVVFVAVIFTMVFGLLNLVTAVIVDTAVRAREADTQSMALQQDEEKSRLWQTFYRMCQELDVDESGCISVEELQRGFHEVPELRQFLTILGVEEEDLVSIFHILDSDKSGSLSFEEFSGELQRLKTSHTQFTVYYIKRLSEELHRLLENLQTPDDAEDKRKDRPSKGYSYLGTRDSTQSTQESTAAKKSEVWDSNTGKVVPPPPPIHLAPIEPLSADSLGVSTSFAKEQLDELGANLIKRLDGTNKRMELFHDELMQKFQNTLRPAAPNGRIHEHVPAISVDNTLRTNYGSVQSSRCGMCTS